MNAFKNHAQKFLFDELAIRGQIVHLEDSFRDILERHDYPESIKIALGHFVSSVTLLSSTIKFEVSLILQAEGEGQVKLMMAECKNNETIRAICRYNENEFDETQPLFKNARLGLTLEKGKGGSYQSLIQLENDDIIKGLEDYFEKSEQIKTRLHLATSDTHTAGMLIQAMPLSEDKGSLQIEDEAFNRIQYLFRTLTDAELLGQSNDEILHRLFHEEKVRVFDPTGIRFMCGCSQESSKAAIQSLGEEDAKALISERGEITVDCQFCKQVYYFNEKDILEIFKKVSI